MTSAVIVPAKMAKKYQACCSRPAGVGLRAMMTLTAIGKKAAHRDVTTFDMMPLLQTAQANWLGFFAIIEMNKIVMVTISPMYFIFLVFVLFAKLRDRFILLRV